MGLLGNLANSLIGGAPGLIGNAIGAMSQASTNKTNMKINQMNNEFNERMMDKQIAYEKEMWNANNEYNSASAQAQRWKDAGMNPTLMMGGANAGVSSSGSVSSASAASPIAAQPFHPDVSSITDLLGNMMNLNQKAKVDEATIRQINSEVEVNKATALKLLGESDNWEIRNKFAHDFYESEVQSMKESVYSSRQHQAYENALTLHQRLLNAHVEEKISTELALMVAQTDEARYNSQQGITKLISDYESRFGKLPEPVKKILIGLRTLSGAIE